MTKLSRGELTELVDVLGVEDTLRNEEEVELLAEHSPILLSAYRTLWKMFEEQDEAKHGEEA